MTSLSHDLIFTIVAEASYLSRILIGKCLMPKDLGPLAHIVIITQRLAIFSHSLLHTVFEVLGVSVAI